MQKLTAIWASKLKLCPSSSQAVNLAIFGYSLPLTEAVVIGREPECQIAIDPIRYPMISRYHARIEPLNTNNVIGWQICDLSSANGTYVNDKRVNGCQVLQAGDRIMLSKDGPEFVFECEQVELQLSGSTLSNLERTGFPSDEPLTPEINPVSDLAETAIDSTSSARELEDTSDSANASAMAKPIKASVSIWNFLNQEDFGILTGHSAQVCCVAFSSDGQLLASGGVDGSIRVWELGTGKEIRALSGHKLAINSISFSPDGQALASGGADKIVKIWNLATGEETEPIPVAKTAINAVAFQPKEQVLASGGADKAVKFWNWMTGEEIRALTGHKMPVSAVAFTLDGQMVASGSADRTIKLWKTDTGEEIAALSITRSTITSLQFSPDAEILAIGSDDRSIKLWNLKREREICTFPGQAWQVGSVAISADGGKFACGSKDNTIRVWSA